MRLTVGILAEAAGAKPARAEVYAFDLMAACAYYGITTVDRLAAFLAQVGHESGGLRYVREIASGAAYEGRKDLGNIQPGDGERFAGRGLIQTTGRANYARVRDRLRARLAVDVPDFEADPAALEEPKWAAWSAADYWDMCGLNALADAGDFEAITRKINGGLNGQDDRLKRWEKAKVALAQAADAQPAPAPAPTTYTPAGELAAQEQPMLPFVAAAIPALLDEAPSLIRIFGNSPQAEKNAKAAEAVAEIAKKATGEPTVEGAVSAIQADPDKAAAYREAVHQSMGDLLGLMLQANEADEKSRVAATDRNIQLGTATGGRWLWLLGAIVVIVVIVSYLITAGVLFSTHTTFSDETKALLLGQIVIFGFTTVLVFLFGSNISNRIDQRDKQQRGEQ